MGNQGFRFSAILVMLVLTFSAHAQRPEKLGGEMMFMPDSSLEGAGSLGLHQEAVKGSIPVWRDPEGKTKLIMGGTFRRTELLFKESAEWTDAQLYDAGMLMQVQRSTRSNLTWSLMVTPSLASDFEQISSRDFRLTVLGLGSYQTGPEWRWVGGVYYGQAFGEPRFFPTLGTVWSPSPEWAVSILMPRPSITYTPNRSWSLTALLQPTGGDWNIRDQERSPNLILETWRAGVEAGWRLNPGVQFFAETGYAFSRSLERRDGDETLQDESIDPCLYFRAGLKIY